MILFVRYRSQFPVVQFQNQAYIRNPHETGQVFKIIWGAPGAPPKRGAEGAPHFFFHCRPEWGARGAPNCFFFFYRRPRRPKGGAGGGEKSRRRRVFREYLNKNITT